MTNDLPVSSTATRDDIGKAAGVLLDSSKNISLRFRALFLLRNADPTSASEMSRATQGMVDCLKMEGIQHTSALLKHECAYCLGQIGANVASRPIAVPALFEVLCDPKQPIIARHEAGEALGAIGAIEYLPQLEKIAKSNPSVDMPIEVTQTCELALDRIHYISSRAELKDSVLVSPFESVDPAPAHETLDDVKELGIILADLNKSLFDRYKAMFSLRNIAGAASDRKLADEAVHQLTKGFNVTTPEEALVRHEVAFVLGQLGGICEKAAIGSLLERLADPTENPMVRHEAAEALGSVANESYTPVLEKFAKDTEPVVAESCVVALDFAEYERSTSSFEYATLAAC